VCSKLQIPAKVASTKKINKLAATMKASKEEIGKVWFVLQLNILELQLKL